MTTSRFTLIVIAGLFGPPAGAQLTSLERPLDAATATTLQQRNRAQRQRAPQEEWRQKAVRGVKEENTPSENFILLTEGLYYLDLGRNLPTEFLKSLSENQMAQLFEVSLGADELGVRIVETRLRIANEILERPIVDLKSAASLEQARMRFNLSTTTNDAIAAFEACSSDSEIWPKAQSAIAAIVDPQTKEDFEEGLYLLELSNRLGRRLQPGWIVSTCLQQEKREGFDHYMPSAKGGEPIFIRMLTRCAFEKGQTDLLQEIYESLPSETLSQEIRNELQFFVGMDAYANGSYSRAKEVFELVLASNSDDIYSAHSSLRLGDSLKCRSEWTSAALVYYDTKAHFSQFPIISDAASDRFDFLIRTGRASATEVTMTIDQREKKLSMLQQTGAGQ